jgi:hypothetical protein
LNEQVDRLRVDASPEKRFFVDMLVKDIELLPAILDLVDNCIDGARRLRQDGSYAGLSVKITVTPDKFEVADTCGGMDLDIARNYAFRFGRPAAFKGTPGSVGQFGVGMKRALFKLGNKFFIESNTQTTHFTMDIDVDEWVRAPGGDWSFQLAEANEGYNPKIDEVVGTTIQVNRLHQSVVEDFSTSHTLSSLKYQLRLRHGEAMARGLDISLNGESVTPFQTVLSQGDGLEPIATNYDIEQGSGVVQVRIYAGVSVNDENYVDDEPVSRERDAGWYVFCNGRLLLPADRSSTTGWGDGMPVYHPQYRAFRGYVYMDSVQTELLPWNTTKTGVDRDSRIWRKVRGDMISAGRQVVSLLNSAKSERQNTTADEPRPITRAITDAKQRNVHELIPRSELSFPKTVVRRQQSTIKKMQYSVALSKFNAIAEVLGTTVVAEVGRQTFDYFYDNQVDEG